MNNQTLKIARLCLDTIKAQKEYRELKSKFDNNKDDVLWGDVVTARKYAHYVSVKLDRAIEELSFDDLNGDELLMSIYEWRKKNSATGDNMLPVGATKLVGAIDQYQFRDQLSLI